MLANSPIIFLVRSCFPVHDRRWRYKRLTLTAVVLQIFPLDLVVRSHSEQFTSDRVIIALEWILLNSQIYYQQLLRNVSISAAPPLNNLMFTGNMRVQLVLSYNTLYNVSVTQHSTCQQLIRTTFLLLNYSKPF